MSDATTPETYRGIKVPAELANRATSIEWHMWRLAVVGVLDTVVPLLEEFEDPEPCSLDHHGYCQEHGSTSIPCDVAAVKAFLDGARHDECVWVVNDLLGTSPLYWCYRHRPAGIHTDRQNLVLITDLPSMPGIRRCAHCGRELTARG